MCGAERKRGAKEGKPMAEATMVRLCCGKPRCSVMSEVNLHCSVCLRVRVYINYQRITTLPPKTDISDLTAIVITIQASISHKLSQQT